jgi:hypothetical protein
MAHHSHKTAAALVLLAITAGCANVEYPQDWQSFEPANRCDLDGATYTDQPVASTGETQLRLSDIFFEETLSGFTVTHVSFTSASEGGLNVNAWVDETMLNETRHIEVREEPCKSNKLATRTGWDMDGYLLMSGLVWTGGIYLPLAVRAHFDILLTTDRDMVVHARFQTAGMLFYFFPFRATNFSEWFRYAPYVQEGPNVAPAAINRR